MIRAGLAITILLGLWVALDLAGCAYVDAVADHARQPRPFVFNTEDRQ